MKPPCEPQASGKPFKTLSSVVSLRRRGSQFILIETRPYFIRALEKFKDKPPAVSFTDCIVMVVADDYGTKDIFGFDKQFEEAGYHRLEPSIDWK